MKNCFPSLPVLRMDAFNAETNEETIHSIPALFRSSQYPHLHTLHPCLRPVFSCGNGKIISSFSPGACCNNRLLGSTWTTGDLGRRRLLSQKKKQPTCFTFWIKYPTWTSGRSRVSSQKKSLPLLKTWYAMFSQSKTPVRTNKLVSNSYCHKVPKKRKMLGLIAVWAMPK